jgi:hypothetical protein
MEIPRLKRRDGVAVDKVLIKAFQNDFHGQIVQPGDARRALKSPKLKQSDA